MLAAELAVAARVVVDAREVFARRDVVVDDRLPLRQLGDLAQHVVAHRVVDEQERVLRKAFEVAPVAHQRAHLGLGLPGEQIGAHVRRPEQALQLERVVADGIAVRDDRMELMRDLEPSHDIEP